MPETVSDTASDTASDAVSDTAARHIAMLTSGGDAPGMNAAIRAITRTALARGWRVSGVRDGYAGLVAGRVEELTSRDVGGILQRGGTVLGSARSPAFRTEDGQREALGHLRQRGVDALVVIGGNGSQAGAHALHQQGLPVVGVASTIDNDLVGSDVSIGVDSALNTALEAVDRLKTTASSHQRAFLVEVMGRDCGYLALATAVASGAEAVVVPEHPTTAEAVVEQLRTAYARGNSHAVAVVGEGATPGTEALLRFAEEHVDDLGFELRATVLGHVQRGAAPGAFDRLLGTRLGAGAVERLAAGAHGQLVGLHGNQVDTVPLTDVIGITKSVDERLLTLAGVLAS